MRSCVPEPYVPEAATRSAPEAATRAGNRYSVSWWATEDDARAEGVEAGHEAKLPPQRRKQAWLGSGSGSGLG